MCLPYPGKDGSFELYTLWLFYHSSVGNVRLLGTTRFPRSDEGL
jgi:hypothetical protein